VSVVSRRGAVCLWRERTLFEKINQSIIAPRSTSRVRETPTTMMMRMVRMVRHRVSSSSFGAEFYKIHAPSHTRARRPPRRRSSTRREN